MDTPVGCLDVHYTEPTAVAACVVLASWTAAEVKEQAVVEVSEVLPYESGAFFRRELPCIEAVLSAVSSVPDILVIDGNVWLERGKMGLGAHLYERRGRVGAVIGVAKTAYLSAESVREVLRGQSQRPLYVSSIGMDLAEACKCVIGMHGSFRVPWALKEVDRLARSGAATSLATFPVES